jgi:ankyrin repeat protein
MEWVRRLISKLRQDDYKLTKGIVVLIITLVAVSLWFALTKSPSQKSISVAQKTSATPSSKIQNKKDQALIKAATDGDVLRLQELMKSSTSQPTKDKALEMAARENHLEVVLMLLEWGSRMDSDPFIANTVLRVAVNHGDMDLARKAIQARADVNAKTSGDSTLLIDSVKEKNLNKLDCLLRLEADVNLQNGSGQTALIYASDLPTGIEKDGRAIRGDYEIVRKLLNVGAEVNSRTFKGSSALYSAISANNVQIVGLLLDAGADPRIGLNSRPLEEIVLLLEKSDAKLPGDGNNDWAKDTLATINISEKRIAFLENEVLNNRMKLGLSTVQAQEEISYYKNKLEELQPEYNKWLHYLNSDVFTRDAANRYGNRFEELEIQARLNQIWIEGERYIQEEVVLNGRLNQLEKKRELREKIDNAKRCIESKDAVLQKSQSKDDIARLRGEREKCERDLAETEKELAELLQKLEAHKS